MSLHLERLKNSSQLNVILVILFNYNCIFNVTFILPELKEMKRLMVWIGLCTWTRRETSYPGTPWTDIYSITTTCSGDTPFTGICNTTGGPRLTLCILQWKGYPLRTEPLHRSKFMHFCHCKSRLITVAALFIQSVVTNHLSGEPPEIQLISSKIGPELKRNNFIFRDTFSKILDVCLIFRLKLWLSCKIAISL